MLWGLYLRSSLFSQLTIKLNQVKSNQVYCYANSITPYNEYNEWLYIKYIFKLAFDTDKNSSKAEAEEYPALRAPYRLTRLQRINQQNKMAYNSCHVTHRCKNY